MNDAKKGIIAGVFAGLIATACCWPIVVFIFLGLGSITSSLSFLGTYALGMKILSVLFFLGALYFFIKRKHGKCNLQSIKQNKKLLSVAIVIYVALIILISYILVPVLTR